MHVYTTPQPLLTVQVYNTRVQVMQKRQVQGFDLHITTLELLNESVQPLTLPSSEPLGAATPTASAYTPCLYYNPAHHVHVLDTC